MTRNSILVLLVSVFLTACGDFGLFGKPQAFSEKTLSGSGTDKIAVIHITGILSSIPKEGLLNARPSLLQEIVAQLRLAEKDPSVKAIVLAINSPGGSVTASDILYHEIDQIRKAGKKQVHAIMMDVAASGGYYIALASNSITAHPTSITGSIGVIVTRISLAELLSSYGVETVTVQSGAMKNMGSILRKPSKEETAIVQNLVDTMNTRFQELVHSNRPKAPQDGIYKDGRILSAQQALDLGLIDSIDYFDATIARIKKGLSLDKAKVITYQRVELPNGTEYNSPSMKVAVEEIMPANLNAGFYYLWSEATL